MLQDVNEVKVNNEYTRYVNGSELIGFIPVESFNVCWYALKQENADNKFVMAVFAVPNNRVVEIYSASSKGMIKMPQPEFVFESENGVLEGKNKEAAKIMKEHIKNHPFVLVFRGSNRDKGMRFKNRQEAMDFLNLFTYFDEVMDEKDLQDNG